MPLAKALPLAGKLGADAVEIDARWSLPPSEMTQTAARQLRKALDDHRLRVCSISYFTRRGYNVLQDLDARIAGTKKAMEMAYALGASVVVNDIGHIPTEQEGQSWNLLVEVLTDLGRHGQRVGAFLAAHTGSAPPADLARLIKALPEGSIGVDLDPGQLVSSGFSSLEAVEQLAPHILHVRATDGVYDLSRRRGMEVALGRGSVDFPSLLGALEERDYRGYFTLQRTKSEDPAYEIGQAVQYLRNL